VAETVQALSRENNISSISCIKMHPPCSNMSDRVISRIPATPTSIFSPHNYTSIEIDRHFQDSVVPSKGQAKNRSPGGGTFHQWAVTSNLTITLPSSDLIDLDPTSSAPPPSKEVLLGAHIISRVTIFDHAAQPMYPPYIFTRSEPATLASNVGRIIPLFRQVPHDRNKHVADGYVKIIAIDIVPARSDELTEFVEKKIAAGGLRRERTKEQWDETVGTDWWKVTLRPVEVGMGDPMKISDIRGALIAPEPERCH
jgi:hypothetical protein